MTSKSNKLTILVTSQTWLAAQQIQSVFQVSVFWWNEKVWLDFDWLTDFWMKQTTANSKDTNWIQYSSNAFYAQWNTKNTGTVLQRYNPSTLTWINVGSSTFYRAFTSVLLAFSIRYYDSIGSDYGNPIVCYRGL